MSHMSFCHIEFSRRNKNRILHSSLHWRFWAVLFFSVDVAMQQSSQTFAIVLSEAIPRFGYVIYSPKARRKSYYIAIVVATPRHDLTVDVVAVVFGEKNRILGISWCQK